MSSKIKITGVICIVIVVFVVAYQTYLSTTFHITGTTPNTNSVGAVSSFIQINFNHQLSKESLSLSSDPSIVTSYSLSGDSLRVSLRSPMKLGQKYSLTIASISDVDGNTLLNKAITFTPQDLSTQQIVKNQGLDGVVHQSQPRTKNDIAFVGFSALTDLGVSSETLTQVESSLFIFKKSAKKISLDPSSTQFFHDKNSDASTSINFNVGVDNATYVAKMIYDDQYTFRLQLFDVSSRALVYDTNTSN